MSLANVEGERQRQQIAHSILAQAIDHNGRISHEVFDHHLSARAAWCKGPISIEAGDSQCREGPLALMERVHSPTLHLFWGRIVTADVRVAISSLS